VNGACVAGGLETILCCDFVLASGTATFADGHSRIGIVPALGAVSGLVRSAGAHRAMRLLMLSEFLDAEEMSQLGIVTEVVEPSLLVARAQDLAESLSSRSPVSLALMKAAVHRSESPSWEEHVLADQADFRSVWGTPQMREGFTAHSEGRRPAYA
jgi:enoyl-CoA hydratase/carnithine racemase